MTNEIFECLAAIVLISLVTSAPAQDLVGFQMPSKNVGCVYSTYDGKGVLRCDIAEVAARPPRPADCQQEWGHAFEMEVKGGASRICAGDTVIDPRLPLLAYGEVWQRGGFTCRSEQAGLTCFNATQHGFSLARSAQQVF